MDLTSTSVLSGETLLWLLVQQSIMFGQSAYLQQHVRNQITVLPTVQHICGQILDQYFIYLFSLLSTK